MSEALHTFLGLAAVFLATAGFGWLWDWWTAALSRQWKRVTR